MYRYVIVIAVTFFLFAVPAAAADNIVLQVQTELNSRGYDAGPEDGLMGPKTRSGIREFQRAYDLPVTGRLDSATLDELGLESEMVTVSSQTLIPVRLDDRLDSGESQDGEAFTMTVSEDVTINRMVAIPGGTTIRGQVVEARSAGRPQKSGRLVLAPTSMTVRGKAISLDGVITAEGRELEGRGSIEEDLKEIGIAAGIGAVLGGLIKGDEGVLAGILIGGGGTFLGTKGEQVELPPETPLIVQLTDPVSVPVAGS